MLVSGGWGNFGPLSSTEVYRHRFSQGRVWIEISALPRPMTGVRLVNLNNKILLFGESLQDYWQALMSFIFKMSMAKRRVAAKGILRFWSFQFGMKSGPELGTCHVPELILQFPLLTLMTTNLIVGRNQINTANAKFLWNCVLAFDTKIKTLHYRNRLASPLVLQADLLTRGMSPCSSWLASSLCHTGLEALPSKKKWSIDGTGVPGFLRPVWLWDGVAKPEKMGKKLNLVQKLVKNT